MGKYISISAVFMAVVGFLILVVLNFTGDIQNHSIIEPVGASLTVGEMRTNPHDSYQLKEDSYGLVGDKGMLASDLMTEVTKELIEGKPRNSIYYVWWVFKDSEGNMSEGLKPSIIEASKEGNFNTGEVLQARDIIETQLAAGESAGLEDNVRDMIVQEAVFKVNRYDESQIIKEGDNPELGEVGDVKDLNIPINSTTFKWSMYKDELVEKDYEHGEGFNVGDIDIETHIDIGVNRVEGDAGVGGTEDIYPELVEEDKEFEVTFVSDGKEVDKKIVKKGGSASLPNVNLSKDGHTFKGWKGKYSGVVRNEVVQAEWELNSIKTRTITLPEGMSDDQTHTVGINNLYELDSYSVDKGFIEELSRNNDRVTFRMSSRPYDREVQTGGSYTSSDRSYVNNQKSPYYNSGGYRGFLDKFVYSGTDTGTKYVSGQSSRYYAVGDYTGTLSSYVYSGSYTPSRSKYVSGQTSSYYSSGGYRGSLSRYVYSGSGDNVVYRYRGTVTRSSSDSRVWRYRGTVTKPDTRVWRYRGYIEKGERDTRTYQRYYQYRLTINYREK